LQGKKGFKHPVRDHSSRSAGASRGRRGDCHRIRRRRHLAYRRVNRREVLK
ncbi:hypothetical protein JG687_00018833, partial [Phytophthora cactorum]